MNSQKQTFWKKFAAICLSVAVIFSGINPAMFAQAETAANTGETITVTVNVAPSTVNATFYEGDDAKTALTDSQVTDKGIVDKYHQYELKVEKGRYSYRGVDTLGTEDTTDDVDLGGMVFDVPINEEIMEDGNASGEGQVLTLRRTNFYTTNANVKEVGDYNLQLYPAGLPDAVNGAQYMGTIGNNTTQRVITPVLTMARGNALTYQGKITLNETLSETYGVATIVNYTIAASTSVNSKTFSLATLMNHTITAPKGAKAQVFNQINNFNVEELQQTGETDNGDGTITHNYKAIGSNLTYRVSMKDKITRAGYFGNKTEEIVVTYDENEDPSVTGHNLDNKTIQNRMEASTMVNVNGQNNLKLATGDTFRLRAYRGAWQIVNTDTANIMIEPDFRYNVISGGEHIEMTPATNKCTGNAGTGNTTNWMDIKGVSAGIAILEVSYDAIQIGGNGTSYDGLYGATDPQRKSLMVINVGESGNTLQMKATNSDNLWDTEYDTVYFTEKTGELDFSATLGEEKADKVELSTDKGSTWKSVIEKEDVYHAEGLIAGNNILRFTKGDKVEYQVVRAAKVSYTMVNKTRDSEEVIAGDDVNIVFKGLYTPVSKFSGIYNPGFGQGHKVTYTTPDTVTVTAGGGQYDFITTNTYTVSTTTAGTVNLTGGYVAFNNMGVDDPLGGHRILTDAGCGTNFSAVSTQHTRGVLPDITFDVVDMPYTPVTVTVDVEGTVITITDEAGKTVTAENDIYTLPYGTYKYVAAKEGYVTERGIFTVEKADYLQGKKTVSIDMRKVEGAIWDGSTMTQPAVDENGVYQIGTGAELAWFAQNAGGTSYNAVLTDNISLGGFNWTPIAKSSGWNGTFDGQGHTVTDLYIDSTDNNVALFGYVSSGAVIKNLGVKGDVTTTGKVAAGIATAKAANVKFTIENCKSEVNVTANTSAAGIISGQSANQTVKNCYNAGDIKVTINKSSSLTAGGVSCPSTQSQKVVLENCYNTGRISGVGKHGSVVYVSSASYGTNVKNCYGLVGTCNTKTVVGTDVTKTELKALAPTLGDAYFDDIENINNGYPVLNWEAAATKDRVKPAKDALNNIVKLSDYRKAEQAEIRLAILEGKAAMDEAATMYEVEQIAEDVKAVIEGLETDAALTDAEEKAKAEADAAAFAAVKAAAKKEVAEYKDPADYRTAEAASLADVIANANAAIEAAETVDAVEKAVSDAKAAMNAIKTDAELSAAEMASQIGKLEEDAKETASANAADKAALEQEITGLKQTLEETKTLNAADKAALEQEIAGLTQTLEETKALNAADKAALEQEIAGVKQAIEDAKSLSASDKAALEAEIAGVEAELKKTAEAEKTAVNKEIAAIKESLKTADSTSAADKKALEDAIAGVKETLNAATGMQKADKEALEKQISALQTQVEALGKTPEPVVLKAPSKLKATNDAKTGRVKLTWQKVEGADEYIIYRAIAKDAPYRKMFTTTGTKYTNITADPGKTYFYKVKAVADDKTVVNSGFSKIVKRTYDLSRPVVIAKSKTKKQVKLSWKKVDGAKKYVVYRASSKDGKYKKVATTTKLSFTNKKLKSGKTYFYKVKAIAKNSAANSAYSVVDKCKVK